MSVRLTIPGKGFGHRLYASLGAQEAFRSENWLCTVRIVLAACCFAWARLAIVGASPQPWRVQVLLNSYLLVGLLLLVLLRLHGAADSGYRRTALAIDLVFAGAVTAFTTGSESAYGMLWVFVVVSAAYRWGRSGTNLTAVVCVLLLITGAVAFRLEPGHFKNPGQGYFTVSHLLIRDFFLVAASLLLGHLVARERQLRAESVCVARMVGKASEETEMDRALQSLFSEIVPLYLPQRALVALRKENAEEVFSWEIEDTHSKEHGGIVKTVLQFSKLEAAALSCPAHTWFFERGLPPHDSPYVLAYDSSWRNVDFLASADLQTCFPEPEVRSLMVSSFFFGKALSGRLILVNPDVRKGREEALRFLQRLVRPISPLLQNIYLSRDIRSQMEDQVRARLARELHDGTLPSLLSAEMQVEVLKKQGPDHPGELEFRLTNLQSLIRQEALNLRDLIESTKPLNFGPGQLPDFLAEVVARFRRETGISVRLETGDDSLTFAQTTCHEIVRIVQEGLSNVRKHSGARNVVIKLSKGSEGEHRLLIADDGLGFGFRGRATQTQLDASHRGPGVIKERVRLIGGELAIDSSPGHGTRLEITIPSHARG